MAMAAVTRWWAVRPIWIFRLVWLQSRPASMTITSSAAASYTLVTALPSQASRPRRPSNRRTRLRTWKRTTADLALLWLAQKVSTTRPCGRDRHVITSFCLDWARFNLRDRTRIQSSIKAWWASDITKTKTICFSSTKMPVRRLRRLNRWTKFRFPRSLWTSPASTKTCTLARRKQYIKLAL